ncbi:hypothetical protein HYC85_018406 [Camellia sinensis]|uniref:Gnk2-homologous domain-containing protein n=1 Tax=Camellia sinensis TaxID=4442 RepID=A0A7J7GU87_CAMSI|nr:hypothetical protein HYC85_018406 [Camellia sinensis]
MVITLAIAHTREISIPSSPLSLFSNIDKYGFYNSSVGQNPDWANAIMLCRGDVELQACRSCINYSITNLTQFCPNYKEAIDWYVNCMLRYSNANVSITGTMTDRPAASFGGLCKFAAGSTTGPDFQTIFGLVQCTPDIIEQECTNCLLDAAGEILNCCIGKKGARVVRPSCNLQYDIYNFFNTIPADALPVGFIFWSGPIAYISFTFILINRDREKKVSCIEFKILQSSIPHYYYGYMYIDFLHVISLILRYVWIASKERKPNTPRKVPQEIFASHSTSHVLVVKNISSHL